MSRIVFERFFNWQLKLLRQSLRCVLALLATKFYRSWNLFWVYLHKCIFYFRETVTFFLIHLSYFFNDSVNHIDSFFILFHFSTYKLVRESAGDNSVLVKFSFFDWLASLQTTRQLCEICLAARPLPYPYQVAFSKSCIPVNWI